MSRVVTIDVEARFVDNVTDESKAASKAIEGIGKEADKLNKKKAKPTFDADDNLFLKKIRNMEAKMSKMGHTKTAAVLDVVDKATSKLMSISSTTKKVTSGLESLTKKTWTTMVKVKDMALAPIKAIKNALFSIPTLITAVVSAKIVQKAVLEPINLADQYSSAKIGFETLLGEAEALAMMNDIDLFAKATPFKTSNVISNVQKMMAYGWDVERVIDDMETIGDAAAATGKGDAGLESIVRALAEIRSKGKLSTQELNQLAGAGIKAKAYLAEGLGYGSSDAGMMKLAKDLEGGAIGANQAIELILQGMQEFDGMMDKTANETVEGLKSQLEDVFEINIARRWGQGLQDGAKRGLGTIVSLLDDADESLAAVGDTLYELGQTAANWAADKLEAVVDKINEITGSFEFKNASAKDKASMLWEGVVKDPLKKWWEETGKTAVTETATDIGKSIGKGILGGIEMAWNAMPWWGKLLVGGYAAGKVVSGTGNVLGGIGNIFGALGSTAGGIRNLIGSTGNSMVSGSGLLGKLANIGYNSVGGAANAAGYFGASGGLSGGLAALLGGVQIAGLTGTVASAIHSVGTLRQAVKDWDNGDEVSAKANLTRSGSTAIGLGAGALGAMGMAKLGGTIGTFFGGPLGTAVGAGLGGLVGRLGGDYWAKSIEAKKYESEAMQELIKDGASEEKKAAQLAEDRWKAAKKHFGDIKLSMEEITRLSNQMVWGDDLEHFESLSSATKSVEANIESIKTSTEDMNRWIWKAGLGVKFNADETEAFAASVTDYISSTTSLLKNKHYEFSMAANLILDPESDTGKSIIKGGNAFYEEAQQELEKEGQKLGTAMTDALADGIISADEMKVITAAQEKVASITEKISDAEMKAELKLAEFKLSEGNMDSDSYSKFIDTMNEQIQERVDAQDKAVKILLSNIELQYTDEEGNITNKAEYEAKVKEVLNQHSIKLDKIKAEVMSFELKPLADAFDGEDALGKDAFDNLKSALETALAENKDPINWEPDIFMKNLNIKKELSEEDRLNIQEALSDIFGQMKTFDIDVDTLLKLALSTEEGTEGKVKNAVDKAVPDKFTLKPDVEITPNPLLSPYTVSPSSLVSLTSNTIYPRINVSPQLSYTSTSIGMSWWQKRYRGGIIGGTSAAEQFALGGRPTDGMLKGSTRFISVNEESPEMIIPLSSQRRARAMKLWAKTGNLLGVPGFARGGMTSGNQDAGIRFQNYGSNDSAGGQSVQIDIGGLTFEINVNGNDTQSITAAIKEQAEEIAEVVAGVLADALSAQFENTPARGGVA